MSDDTDLVCPDCGEEQFSWIANIVQFGVVVEHDSGHRHVITQKNENIAGSDIDENGVFCTGCSEDKEIADLEPKVEVTNE